MIQLLDGDFLPQPHGELVIEDESVEIFNYDGTVVAGIGSKVYAHPGVTVRPEIGGAVYLAAGADLDAELSQALERGDYSVTVWDHTRGAAHPTSTSIVGAGRRLRALAALGWPTTELAARAGLPERALESALEGDLAIDVDLARVTALYEELSMSPGPCASTQTHARRNGWAPPLSWEEDNIDDPNAKPQGLISTSSGGATTVEDLAELAARGLTTREVADRLGVTTSAITQLLRRRQASAVMEQFEANRGSA